MMAKDPSICRYCDNCKEKQMTFWSQPIAADKVEYRITKGTDQALNLRLPGAPNSDEGKQPEPDTEANVDETAGKTITSSGQSKGKQSANRNGQPSSRKRASKKSKKTPTLYCTCQQVSHGDMICCENDDVRPKPPPAPLIEVPNTLGSQTRTHHAQSYAVMF